MSVEVKVLPKGKCVCMHVCAAVLRSLSCSQSFSFFVACFPTSVFLFSLHCSLSMPLGSLPYHLSDEMSHLMTDFVQVVYNFIAFLHKMVSNKFHNSDLKTCLFM